MTFDEIPEFTRPASWRADIDLFTFVKKLDEWVSEDGLQLNPDFQRGHVWTEEQQAAFIEFILRGGTTGRDIYLNHPGWRLNFKGEFVCVDGLQRITAIQKFMSNELKAFGQYYREFGGKPNAMKHYMVVHVNNLQTKREVLKWYIEMNAGGTPHSKEEIARVQAMMDRLVATHTKRRRADER